MSRRVYINQLFYLSCCLGCSTSAPRGLNLESVEGRWIVRCGNNNAAVRVKIFDGPGDEWSRCCLRKHRNVKTIATHNLGSTLSKILGKESAVEANYNQGSWRACFVFASEKICICLGDTFDVRKSKLAGNHCPPAVSAE